MLPLLLLTGWLTTGCRAAIAPVAVPSPASFAALGLPPALSKARVQGLLQNFVAAAYGRSFRRLGDESDFDHGHLLLDARTGRPAAVLYHTQELAGLAASPDRGYLDPEGRNWIQWLDGRGIENARRYERARYPRSGSWDWFVAYQLPKLRLRHTITDRMLDPALLGAELKPGPQWTFTRVPCASSGADASSNVITVDLPDRTPVCLALGSS